MARHVTRPCPCMTTSIIINITRVISMWTLHWITVGCSGVGSPMTTGYYCAIFPFCGGGKKKKKTTKKQWHFNWATTSGASDWQACKDSHRNKTRTFVFHKCNLQSLNLKTMRIFIKNITNSEALEVYRCSKAFSVMAWDWGQNRSLHFVSCVFPVWSKKRCRRLTKLQVNTKIKQHLNK